MKKILMSRIAATALTLCAWHGMALGADRAQYRFDVPAQSVTEALKVFAERTKLQVVYYSEGIEGAKSPGASGTLTATEALKKLLDGTGFSFRFLNDRTIAIGSAKDVSRAQPTDTVGQNGHAMSTESLKLVQAVQGETIAGPSKAAEVEDAAAKNPEGGKAEVTVTGSRIRTLVGEQTLQSVFIMDRKAIERTGAADLGEVFKFIPQISSSSSGTGQEAFSTSGGADPLPNSYVLSANLHGFSGTQTLILVDGKRVNKSNQVSIDDRFDIIGLPLGSVERIEVMLDGASAIYGADALAGVINIITRKNYNGTEARINYDNVFSTDASKQDYQLSHGISRDNWNVNISASHQRTTALASRDLAKTRSSDRRPFGGFDGRDASVRVVPGWIESANGSNLPGLSTSRAPIPGNSTGVGLTVADYANAYAALSQPWDPENFWQFDDEPDESLAWGERWDPASVSEEPTQRQSSVRVNGEYSFNDAVSVYASASYLKVANEGYVANPYSTEGLFFNFETLVPVVAFANGLTLPAGYPGNPFGVPIILHKNFLDNMGRVDIDRSTSDGQVGLRGALPKGWRYDVSATLLKSKSEPDYRTQALFQEYLQSTLNSATPPVLLYDSTRRSIPSNGALFSAVNRSSISIWEKPESRTYTADADGPIWRLPAGDVRLALSLESREDIHDTNADLLEASNGYSFAVGAEVRVPVISPEMQVRGLHRVEFALAGRHDRYSEYPEATNPSYRLMVQPVSWLSLRATRSEGTRVPSLFISNNVPHGIGTFTPPGATRPVTDPRYIAWTDPLRNNERVQAPFREVVTGNQDLRMEQSRSNNYSMTVDVPGVPGLSVTGSYWTTENFNSFASAQDVLTFREIATLFPELVVREPSTGPLPGRATGWIASYVNLSASEHAGWDAMTRYDLDTALGTVNATVNMSRTTKNALRVEGPAGPVDTSGAGVRQMPLRLSGSLFWSRGAVTAGTNVTYNGRAYVSSDPSDSESIPGSTRWDLQVGYNFGRADAAFGGWLGTLTKGTRVNFTVFNILNEDPPLLNGNYEFGTIEIRQQRYSLNVTKEF